MELQNPLAVTYANGCIMFLIEIAMNRAGDMTNSETLNEII